MVDNTLEVVTNSIGMKFKLIPAGSFVMGSNDYGDEQPVKQRSITQPFYLGIHEVTQEQYKQVRKTNPSYFQGPQKPVENVLWKDATAFCKYLSELPAEESAGRTYRLPMEAEWEYAVRAGSTGKWCFGDDESRLGEYAWYSSNSNGTTHPVGQKKPNAWGLYDMHGNVWEWCADWYDSSFYATAPVSDPVNNKAAAGRVSRGGGWFNGATRCRSANRRDYTPSNRNDYLGLRVALVQHGAK